MTSRPIPAEVVGTQVCVHLNLTLGCFVVADKPKGRIYGYAETVTLSDVTFKVSEAQRQYCLRKHGRWVHAWALGTLVSVNDSVDTATMVTVTYNPFRGPTFTRSDTGETVDKVRMLHFADRHCHAYADEIL